MTALRSRLAALAALALAAGSCVSAARPPAAPPLPEVVIEAPPVAPTEPEPPAPQPPAAEPEPPPPALPERVRIGLLTDLESVTIPCCRGTAMAAFANGARPVGSAVTVRPAAAASELPVWRLQVAALREPEEAEGLASRLAALAAAPADARFDAGSGLYRVRVGRWVRREDAEQGGRALQRRGLDAFWVVSEGNGPIDPALEVTADGTRSRIPGRRFELAAAAGGTLELEGRRFRGSLVVFLNDRGRLNVINELPLEDYLRGVVPRELGPDSYPQLEALKAQAVAARSYTLRNLGGFAEEGYDLCGTPKCQVYGGAGAEHPLSDRAVAETAGEVLLGDGAAIDALYTATCGGRTENVEVIFPLKSADYLRGVACIEAGPAVVRAAVPQASRWPPAGEGGAPEPARATFERLVGSDLLVRLADGRHTALRLGRATATFVRTGDAAPRAGDLHLLPGDELDLYRSGESLVALVQRLHADALPPEKGHSRLRWNRFRSDAEIATAVRQRFPELDFRGLDIVSRGPSGRVGRIRLDGAAGEQVEVSGLAVRWLLDLPETWFTLRRERPRGGRPGWRFSGRGWGHGVGLCQAGSYAMSRRGHDYREILAHYYSGARLERLPHADEIAGERQNLFVQDNDKGKDRDKGSIEGGG